MEDKIIEWSTAILAQQCGFEINRESCEGYFYDGYGKLAHPKNKMAFSEKLYPHEQEAPTQSLLCKWLREKYNIHVYVISYDNCNKIGWFYSVEEIGGSNLIPTGDAYTHDLALEEGIKAALTYIKSKN